MDGPDHPKMYHKNESPFEKGNVGIPHSYFNWKGVLVPGESRGKVTSGVTDNQQERANQPLTAYHNRLPPPLPV